MADAEKQDRYESEQDAGQRRAAGERIASGRDEAWDDVDPREEEGWSQPESSAQKGAVPDEG